MALGGRALGAVVVVLMLAFAAPTVRAADTDPAISQVDRLDTALLDVMKHADELGPKGRARKLTPTIEQTFDLAAMTRFAVGPSWSTMSDTDHAALIEAFKRFTAASYAHNFDGYSGETFKVDPNVVVRGPDKVVQTQLITSDGKPVSIAYRMRDKTGSWKIIDVLYQGSISQLTTRRSDFAASVASGGAKALLTQLNAQTDKLLQ